MPTKTEWIEIATRYAKLRWGERYKFVMQIARDHGVSRNTVFRHIRAVMIEMKMPGGRKSPRGSGLSLFPQSTLRVLVHLKMKNPELSGKRAQELLREQGISPVPHVLLVYELWRRFDLPVGRVRTTDPKERLMKDLEIGFRRGDEFDPEEVFQKHDLGDLLNL